MTDDPMPLSIPPDPEGTLAVPTSEALGVPEEWGLGTSKRQAQLKRARHGTGGVRHGVLSTIPMVCKDYACPFKAQCVFQQRGEVTAGERCILEIGKLTEWSERYYREFGVDPTNPEQRADAVIIQQLLMTEIVIERCQMALSSGDLIEDIEVAMNPQGDVISQPMVHKAAELLPKYQRRQNELLGLMLATRKDKVATTGQSGATVNDILRQLIERASMAAARQQLMRDGHYKEAETVGFQYGLDAHKVEALPAPEED